MERTPKNKKSAESGKPLKSRMRKKRKDPTALFSSTEVRQFVSEFVASWIRGDIIIHFPTAAELSKKNPLAIGFPADPSISHELKIKEHYIDLLSICAGIKQASVDEQDKAIGEVFRMMLMFRSANRIEGKILSNDIEKRIDNLEEKFQATANLVDQITSYLFKPVKADETGLKKATSEASKSKIEG